MSYTITDAQNQPLMVMQPQGHANLSTDPIDGVLANWAPEYALEASNALTDIAQGNGNQAAVPSNLSKVTFLLLSDEISYMKRPANHFLTRKHPHGIAGGYVVESFCVVFPIACDVDWLQTGLLGKRSSYSAACGGVLDCR